MRKLLFIFINCFFTLFFGGIIYIGYRKTSLLMFEWFNKIGLYDFVFRIRDGLNNLIPNLPEWIKFSLPDGLWLYSFSCTLLILTKNKYFLIIPISTGPLVEIFQYFNIIEGTFDVIDLTFLFLAIILSIFVTKKVYLTR